jgi:hypothetical protein
MTYRSRASFPTETVGSFDADKPTKGAIKTAKGLRSDGFTVTITNRDGKPVDE